MRAEEIFELSAGEELDLLIYDRVMGRPSNDGSLDRGDEHMRRYSTDIRHAERVLLRIVTGGRWSYVPPDPGAFPVTIAFREESGRRVEASAPNKALAICRAALLTVLAKD
jgi:hypothetical protein